MGPTYRGDGIPAPSLQTDHIFRLDDSPIDGGLTEMHTYYTERV